MHCILFFQRRAAEESWEEKRNLPLHIFRLGGIYGRGRSAIDVARRSSSGSVSSSREAKSFTSRVHVDDICQVLEASMMQPRAGEGGEGPRSPLVYNVVDDDPAPRSEVVGYARDLISGNGGLGSTQVPDVSTLNETVSRSLSSNATRSEGSIQDGKEREDGKERVVEEKRVSNLRMKDLLKSQGLNLIYPTYREGLHAIVSLE